MALHTLFCFGKACKTLRLSTYNFILSTAIFCSMHFWHSPKTTLFVLLWDHHISLDEAEG